MVRVPAFVLAVAALVIFLANAGSLVLQLLAGRYLAPFIGSSVETWTCVIGVFLAGIALGNAVGGRIADRHPSTRALGLLLILGAACSLSMLAGMRICNATNIHQSLPLTPRIPILSFAFCFAPAFVLSLITPLTIKLMLADVKNAGRITGLIFALSTLGCLLGNYLTGFYFMADFTLDQISVGVAVSLAVLGLLVLPVQYRAPVSEDEDGPAKKFPLARAYAIVFTASFCGMSLELTASRYLAPILGVSLYSWTGIIGVMLAGTALGNFAGGMVADRGPTLVAIGRAIVNYRGLSVLLLFTLGAFLGLALSPLAGERLAKFFDPEMRAKSELLAHLWAFVSRHSELVGAGLGGALLTMLLLPTPAERERILKAGISPTHILATGLMLAGLATICILATTAILTQGFQVYDETIEPIFAKTVYVDDNNGVWVSTINRIVGFDLVNLIVGWTFLLFFVPMFLLGMVSPQVIRLSVPDVSHVGRVAGSIYAWSTFGAIVGTFATGYFLIAALGTWSMLLVIALVLTALAVTIGRLWKNSVLLFVGSIVMGAACFGLMVVSSFHAKFDRETRYYAIKVNYNADFEGESVASLALDHLSHSFVKIDDPSFLGYTHEEVQGELVRLARERQPDTKCLVIGGGGYTFPRWVDHMLPGVSTDVVEIDPGVTEVAYDKLSLSNRRVEVGFVFGGPGVVFSELWKVRKPSRIRSLHMDGRQYVNEVAPKGHYQLVMQDAVNDLSVPYHLMTKEYNEGIRKILAPDGVYLLTLIDSVRDGVLWRAAVRTMRETYPHVYLIDSVPFHVMGGTRLAANAGELLDTRHVLIVYGADKPIDLPALFASNLRTETRQAGARASMGVGFAGYPSYTHVLDPKVLDDAMNAPVKGVEFGAKPILLRDQYAPVDNLMSGVFRERDR